MTKQQSAQPAGADSKTEIVSVAETEKLRYEEEIQLLLDMLGMHMDAAAWNAKR